MPLRQKISCCLWFQSDAEAAVAAYVDIFPRCRITGTARYGVHGPGPKGAVMSIGFELDGQSFIAVNGGPYATFSTAISLFVDCDTQAEIDRYWEALGKGGQALACGWLTDRFGVTWQINSADVPDMLLDPDESRRDRVMQAMMAMQKIDLDGLRGAFRGP